MENVDERLSIELTKQRIAALEEMLKEAKDEVYQIYEEQAKRFAAREEMMLKEQEKRIPAREEMMLKEQEKRIAALEEMMLKEHAKRIPAMEEMLKEEKNKLNQLYAEQARRITQDHFNDCYCNFCRIRIHYTEPESCDCSRCRK